ncbi:MAG: hypothetical protein H0W81_08045 [Chloroflexi bacterium]|nr:hypothetical protein [Chloroflexota bacterium]
MRALFTSIPATGHFNSIIPNSIIPMALATAAAGHRVAVCCADAYADGDAGAPADQPRGLAARAAGSGGAADPARLTAV